MELMAPAVVRDRDGDSVADWLALLGAAKGGHRTGDPGHLRGARDGASQPGLPRPGAETGHAAAAEPERHHRHAEAADAGGVSRPRGAQDVLWAEGGAGGAVRGGVRHCGVQLRPLDEYPGDGGGRGGRRRPVRFQQMGADAGQAARRNIRRALPNALDLLVVCVESGLGLDQAIIQCAKELEHAHPEICQEFTLVNLELKAGKRRAEALRNLADRGGVDELRKLVAVLIQADKFGTSIAQSLRAHSDYLRVQMHQTAEEKAAKLGVKLIFPIFFCILPSLFVGDGGDRSW